MRTTILLLLTLLPLSVFAQLNWKIGTVISPDICYRTMHFKSSEYGSHYDSLNTDRARFGFRVGVTSTYKLYNKLELEFGILYSEQNLQTTRLGQFGNDSLVDHVVYIQHTRYLMVPVKANVILSEGRFGFVGTAGLSFSYGYHLRMEYTLYDSANTDLEHSEFQDNHYPDFMMCFELGAGARYLFSDWLELRATPIFRYMINSGYHGANSKFTPYTAGLSCSLLWSL